MQMSAGRLCVLIFLVGCGAKPNSDLTASAFHNQTQASDAELMRQWVTAQQTIATTPIDLNPVPRFLDPELNPVTKPPDPRALGVMPHGVTVISIPDIPIAQLMLQDSRWATHTDPSGVISCVGAATLAHSCVFLGDNKVLAAQSLVPQALEWEFENIILNSLGYDVSQR